MRSHEVLHDAAEKIGVKALAAKLRLSPALIYKWCEEADPADPDASGNKNPLDTRSSGVHPSSLITILRSCLPTPA